jgi:hypothetical protein
MVGKSIVGRAEIGSNLYPSVPSKMTPTISSEVATGRRMNGSEILMPVESRAQHRLDAAAQRPDQTRVFRYL